MPSDHDLRTRFAIEANDLADALNAALGTIRLRPLGYKPELTKPEGLSTGGGVAAMQHLRLVPQIEGKRSLVVGHANRATKTAELRNFETVDAMHRKQFNVPVELDRKDYDQFLEMAGNLMAVLRLDTTVTGEQNLRFSIHASMAPPRRSAWWIPFVIGAVVAALALGAVLWYRGR
jgi:hypothetical protein